jgi:hypothetical protein
VLDFIYHIINFDSEDKSLVRFSFFFTYKNFVFKHQVLVEMVLLFEANFLYYILNYLFR